MLRLWSCRYEQLGSLNRGWCCSHLRSAAQARPTPTCLRILAGQVSPIRDEIMASATVPAWQVDREGVDMLLRLSGDWLAAELGTHADSELRRMVAKLGDGIRLRFDATHLGRWDSGLAPFLRALETTVLPGNRRLGLDTSGLPHALAGC